MNLRYTILEWSKFLVQDIVIMGSHSLILKPFAHLFSNLVSPCEHTAWRKPERCQ